MRSTIAFGMLLCASALHWDPLKKVLEKFRRSEQSANPRITQSATELVAVKGLTTEPGCYRRFPSGCWRFPANARLAAWKHETIVEHRNTVANARETCMMRKNRWNTYCNINDTQMMFVPGEVRPQAIPTTTLSQTEEVEVVVETTTPVRVRIEAPAMTTASTTPLAPIQELMSQIEDRRSMSDFDQQVDKEAEDEFNKEKKAMDDAEAHKALERERRTAVGKDAEKARGISGSKRDTLVKTRSMLQDKVAKVIKAAEDVEEKRASLAAAQAAPVEAAVAVANASNLIEEKKRAIGRVEERLDSMEADGREPDDASKQEAVNEREALANARADTEERKAILRQAEQRALEAKAALQKAEAKLSEEEAEKQSLDERLRLAAAEYEAALDRAKLTEDLEIWESESIHRRQAEERPQQAQEEHARVEDERDEAKEQLSELEAEAREAAEEEERRKADLSQSSAGVGVAAEASGAGSAEDLQIEDELRQGFGQGSRPGLTEELQDGPAGAEAEAEDLQMESELRQGLGQGPRPGSAEQLLGSPPGDEGGLPAKPGCYVRMPTGCQDKVGGLTRWRHDVWAKDAAGCIGRKGIWDLYCQREDVEVKYVGA